MAILSFHAKKLEALIAASEAHPQHRKPNINQRYSVLFLRDDLPKDRTVKLISEADEDFNPDIEDHEIDTAKLPAGLWLVGDEGVYATMNVSMSAPGIITTPMEHAVQCFETDLRNIDPEDVFQEKVRIFGGDDGVIFLDADFMKSVCSTVAKLPKKDQIVVLDLDENGLGVVQGRERTAYIRAMRAEDPDFFDPDKKATPELFVSPELEANSPSQP